MAFDLPHDRQAVDGVPPAGAIDAAQIFDLLFFQPLLLHKGLVGSIFHPFRLLFLPDSFSIRGSGYAAAKILFLMKNNEKNLCRVFDIPS